MGSLLTGEGSIQTAYATRPARQPPILHSHQRRQDARGQCARYPVTRSWQLLRHGSGFNRFCSLVHAASSTDVPRYSWQIQSALSAHLRSRRGQIHWSALRQTIALTTPKAIGLPATPSTHQVLRCRTRHASDLYNQQLRLARADYRSAFTVATGRSNYSSSGSSSISGSSVSTEPPRMPSRRNYGLPSRFTSWSPL